MVRINNHQLNKQTDAALKKNYTTLFTLNSVAKIFENFVFYFDIYLRIVCIFIFSTFLIADNKHLKSTVKFELKLKFPNRSDYYHNHV